MRPVFTATVLIAVLAAPADAASPPPQMMANVYRLTEAAAVLNICLESSSYTALSLEKATQFRRLGNRLTSLVQGIAKHYKDDALDATFEATKVRLSADDVMKAYVKNKYQYCSDQLFQDMESYVSENEKLIGGYLGKQPPGAKK